MAVKCRTIMDAMERLAPRRLAENWDNVGLLVGSPEQEVKKIIVALDLTVEVLREAILSGANMIITHHPFNLSGFRTVRTDQIEGKILSGLIKADIALFAAHTNLDSATGGVSDILAGLLGLSDCRPLADNQGGPLFKLVVFVPESHLEVIREAITNAGAGHIGNYSHCSFSALGTGTFLPLAGTNPFIGEQGTMEYTTEYRLETILPSVICNEVVAAMLKAHPYEEVAYDLYELKNSLITTGLGRVGDLPVRLPLGELIKTVKAALNLEYLRFSGDENQLVKRVAVCGGSGASLIGEALKAGAEVMITGDVKYHEAQTALNNEMAIIDAGHFATEQPIVHYIVDYLCKSSSQENWAVEINADKFNKDVFVIR